MGGTPLPPFTDKISGQKGGYGFRVYPPPFTNKIRKVVFDVLPLTIMMFWVLSIEYRSWMTLFWPTKCPYVNNVDEIFRLSPYLPKSLTNAYFSCFISKQNVSHVPLVREIFKNEDRDFLRPQTQSPRTPPPFVSNFAEKKLTPIFWGGN